MVKSMTVCWREERVKCVSRRRGETGGRLMASVSGIDVVKALVAKKVVS